MLLNSISNTRSMIVSERLIRAQHHQFTRAVHQSHDLFAPSKRGLFFNTLFGRVALYCSGWNQGIRKVVTCN